MKKAFSLLEIVLVLCILAFILSLASFYTHNENKILLGAKVLLNDLFYTRHLALMQGNFRTRTLSVATKDEWFKAKWQLYFIRSSLATNNELTYTLFLDKNGDGNANLGRTHINVDREIALDLLNPDKLMSSGQSGVLQSSDSKANKYFNLEKNYGIDKVVLKGACAGATRIIFDDLARLYAPLRTAKHAYDKILFHKNNACIIKLLSKTQSVCIVVDSLSGYAFIPKFQDLHTQYLLFNNAKIPCFEL